MQQELIHLNQQVLIADSKSDLASLKAELDKIDVGKLKTVPVDLKKISNIVKRKLLNKSYISCKSK